MQVELGRVLRGFTVTARQKVDELDAVLWEMEHRKSGARLVWLERPEENKTFGIAFQTQPWDDTGVFHILEHSVLCGSEKYPVKEPFVELLKSSLNTFLNAMTFPDKTLYPVASRNDQDFVNLLRIYMDAVFRPRIHQKPEIFYQEGWHYELDENGVPSYKGVVFNEMKGAMSSPDRLLESEMSRGLFPDNCYRWVSGGDPAHIPELTYEQFAAAHKRLYHPSNSYIFLDGRMDIDRILGILDGEYLKDYDRAPVPGPIPMQRPVDGGVVYADYELSPQEALEGRTILADGMVLCTFRDRETMTALNALADVLCGGNQAPLCRRLLDAGLAKSVTLELYDGVQQPWMQLVARDIPDGRIQEVSDAVYGELERLAREGLDHRQILATLDNMELQARQRDYGRYPQGLMFSFQVLESWLYGGDPAANLSVGTLFDGLRQKCADGYFEELLTRLVKAGHRCRVILRPSHTVGQRRQEEEQARLERAKAGWNREELEALRRQQAALEAWQSAPDSPQALATIPMLRLDQIPPEPEALPLTETRVRDLPLLRHELNGGGISYVNLYFALDDMTDGELNQIGFLCGLLGALDTASFPLEDLQRELRSRLGALDFSVEAYDRAGQPGQGRVLLSVSYSALDAKAATAAELVAEILARTDLRNGKKIFDLLCQQRTALAQQLAMSGHTAAANRAAACYTLSGVVREHTGGIAYLQWLKDLEKNFKEQAPALEAALEDLCRRIFVRSRLTVSVTGGDRAVEDAVAGTLAERLPLGGFTPPAVPAVRPWGRRREGVVIPAGVSFAGMSGLFPQAGQGAALVMCKTASLACLWNTVRAQGGAYGVGMLVNSAGTAGFYSFRDPSAHRTLGCYRQVPDFLEGLAGQDLTGLILGTVAEADPLLTPRMKGRTADAHYWRGVTWEERCRLWREMLAARPEDVAALAPAVRKVTEEGAVCVLGPQRQIDACAGELDTVIVL